MKWDNSLYSSESADTALRNTMKLRATASEIAAPKPDLDAKAKKRRFWSTKKKIKGQLLAPKLRNLLTNHCRSLHTATPILFTRSSCVHLVHPCSSLPKFQTKSVSHDFQWAKHGSRGSCVQASCRRRLSSTTRQYLRSSMLSCPLPRRCDLL